MHVTFPLNVNFTTSSFQVVGASSAPKQSVSGAFSVQPRLGAHWRGSVTFLTTNQESVLAVQAFVAAMEGALGTTSVPVFQRYLPRDGQGRVAPRRAVAPLGDTSLYEGGGSQTSEFWGFENMAAVSGLLAGAADLRATELVIARTNYTDLRPGHDFGIGGRLHRAVQVIPDGVNDRVRITPPLRAAAALGEEVNLSAPTCLMRFSSEEEGQLAYEPGPVSRITMNFIESI